MTLPPDLLKSLGGTITEIKFSAQSAQYSQIRILFCIKVVLKNYGSSCIYRSADRRAKSVFSTHMHEI